MHLTESFLHRFLSFRFAVKVTKLRAWGSRGLRIRNLKVRNSGREITSQAYAVSMVYDIEKQGPIQKEADDFGFWYSVMLMAINEWDSSTIQAYRLYKLGVFMNCEAMSESFQMLADRLRDAKRSNRTKHKKRH